MAKDVIKKIDKEKIKIYLPTAVFVLIIILFFNLILMPQIRKLNDISSKVKNKTHLFSQIKVTTQNIDALKKDEEELRNRIAELEKRLPEQIEANLLIETLKDITKEAKIQFVSIEPKKSEKFESAEKQEVYMELPISVKLRCGYNELSKFVKKIENSKRLMKVRDLKIRANPQNSWEHNVEVTISTFSTLKD